MTAVRVGTSDGILDLPEDGGRVLAGLDVSALARRGSGWFALAGGRELWRGEADAWERMAVLDGPPASCLLPLDRDVLVGTAEAQLVRVRADSPESIDGFDRAPGRDEWYTPWGGPPAVRSLAADAGGTIYANVHVGGILRSTDVGETWEPTIDLHADVHQVLADPLPPSAVLAATAFGLAASDDAGRTWSFQTEGLHGDYCRALAVCGDTLLLSASRGHHGREAALYRRFLAGGAFERCREGLPEWFEDNLDTHCLAAAGSTAALGTSDGEVFVSRDAGRIWERVASGLPAIRCVALSDA